MSSAYFMCCKTLLDCMANTANTTGLWCISVQISYRAFQLLAGTPLVRRGGKAWPKGRPCPVQSASPPNAGYARETGTGATLEIHGLLSTGKGRREVIHIALSCGG